MRQRSAALTAALQCHPKTSKYCCNSKMQCVILYVFHIVVGKRQYVPTGGLLIMALHHFVLDRGHSASIAQIL